MEIFPAISCTMLWGNKFLNIVIYCIYLLGYFPMLVSDTKSEVEVENIFGIRHS